MRVLVCVKQVADMATRFKPNPAGDWYHETDLAFRMNEYDENAVEQAVQLKELHGSASDVTALSIGPARVADVLRKALAVGCDRGIHIHDDAAANRDPWQIASMIARYARGKRFDLILAGMQSQDRGSAQVGVFVAEILGYACTTTVVALALDGAVITVKRELEGGCRAVVKLKLPAVVTCQLGLNRPRYATLPNVIAAKKKPIEVVPVDQVLEGEARVTTTRFWAPAKLSAGQILEGSVDEIVPKLVTILEGKTGFLTAGAPR